MGKMWKMGTRAEDNQRRIKGVYNYRNKFKGHYDIENKRGMKI